MRAKQKLYSVDTVLRAQRRVLAMVAKVIVPDRLYAVGVGLMTGEELLEHINGARRLKVRRAQPRDGEAVEGRTDG